MKLNELDLAIISKIQDIISDSIDELNHSLSNKITLSGGDTALYGDNGTLDSLSLVTLIVSIEERITETLGINLILANEKAFSQKFSPFKSYASLANYVCELLTTEATHE